MKTQARRSGRRRSRRPVAANTASLHAAVEFVQAGALEAGLPEGRIGELALLIEELFMNVCQHAYVDGAPGVVTLT